MLIRALLATATTLVIVAGCARGESEERGATNGTHAGHPAPNTVTIVANDFAFEAPSEIPAGVTRFVLKAQGQHIHHATIAKLEDGKTVADLMEAFKTPGPPPSWVTFVGGPNVPDPGAEANATVDLAPGNYVLICFVDTPDKVPHFAKGMFHAFTVTPASATARAPNADVSLVLSDYVFTFDKPLTAGRHTIKVENTASQDHEIELVKLAPGKTLADFEKWLAAGMAGALPGSAVGGIASMKPGTVNYFDVDLAPGEYVAICFVPDEKDGKPHLMHGMVRQFSVGA